MLNIAPKKAAFRSGLQRSSSSSGRCSKIYFAYCKTWSNSACKFGCLAISSSSSANSFSTLTISSSRYFRAVSLVTIRIRSSWLHSLECMLSERGKYERSISFTNDQGSIPTPLRQRHLETHTRAYARRIF